jgi:hypothetical protein
MTAEGVLNAYAIATGEKSPDENFRAAPAPTVKATAEGVLAAYRKALGEDGE